MSNFLIWDVIKTNWFQIRYLRPVSGLGCVCDALLTLPSVPFAKPAPPEAKFLGILKIHC